MNQHQLNGVTTFIETLDSAAANGIVLRGSVHLEVDGQATGFMVVYEDPDASYRVVPAR